MFYYTILLIPIVILHVTNFFPIPNTYESFSNKAPLKIGNSSINVQSLYKKRFNKTIVIIIDALRWDFVTPQLMPLTYKLIKQKSGCIDKIRVDSPTVTLPRIKALTTGNVPQYLDIIRNLASSSETIKDSWLHSAKSKNLSLVFYGDDTWLKLFPSKKFFTRSEGTSSFFVWDFHEVDDNVTRNVNLELNQQDSWDIMILHYLGLDHIGHVLGPFSEKIPQKLKEMDIIIDKVFNSISSKDTLLLVTGDHGMKDSGGHGGNSEPEIIVPLITIGHNCSNSSYFQTDISVNLAILLGLNIPTTSIGILQENYLNLPEKNYLYALRYNSLILSKKCPICDLKNATISHEEYLKKFDNKIYVSTIKKLYKNCILQIRRKLDGNFNKSQSSSSILISLLLILTIFISIVETLIGFSQNFKVPKTIILYSLIILLEFLINSVIVRVISGAILLVIVLQKLKNILKYFFHSIKFYESNFLQLFCIFICIGHPLTFISSSFIEEEHYFWMFSCVTLIILLFFIKMLKKNKSLLIILILIRFSMDLNSSNEMLVQLNNWGNILEKPENNFYHKLFFGFNLIMLLNSLKYYGHLNCIILVSIFYLKSLNYHNALLGKLIWFLILFSKENIWIFSSALIIKPHNIILIVIALNLSKLLTENIKSTFELSFIIYILSNSFYFLQGHRNSLASVDISVGYIGLNDYNSLIVSGQIFIHTYIFPILFHLMNRKFILENFKQFWVIQLALKTLVYLMIVFVTFLLRHHLFIWSVFAPKLLIESIHTITLSGEFIVWLIYYRVNKTFT